MIEGVNILGAGADTTAIAILAILGQLLMNEAAYKKAQRELDEATAAADGQELDFQALEKLPYL